MKGQHGAILLEVALLTVIVILVDETTVRAAMAFVPALLLAQRALKGAEASDDAGSGRGAQQQDRRVDDLARKHIDEFLSQFRDFYAICHRLGSGELSSDEALERTAGLERNLNRLLAEVTSATREKAGLAAPSGT